MKLEDFKALANPATGLVPMVVKRSFAPYFPGSVNGFTPSDALQHYLNGDAVPYGVVAPPPPPKEPPILHSSKVPVQRDEEPKQDGPVAIPEDWESLHHLQRFKLAKDISGADKIEAVDGKKPLEVADDIIRAEIERRAGKQA